MTSFKRLCSKQERALLLSFLLLLTHLSASDWQASGNMTAYLPQIRGFIDAAIADGLDRQTIAQNISDECNSQWDTFWNVMVAWLRDSTSDMILYGYAFRNHWFWTNNYNSTGRSYVIWKDYHCETDKFLKYPLSDSVPTGYSWLKDQFLAALTADPTLETDVWRWAHDTVQNYLYTYYETSLPASRANFGISVLFITSIPSEYSYRYCYTGADDFATNHQAPYFYVETFINRLDPSA